MTDDINCLNCETGPYVDGDKCPNCGADHALVWADEHPLPIVSINQHQQKVGI